MREILFRGQTRKFGEKVWMSGEKVPGNWVYGGICHGPGDYSIIYGYQDGVQSSIDKFVVHTDTVGQSTGLKDKTQWEELSREEQAFWLRKHTAGEWAGRPIFEGDIVAHYNSRDKTTFDVGLILWDKEFCMFLRTSQQFPKENPRLWADCRYKVIGNIYDDPRLVEEYELTKYIQP